MQTEHLFTSIPELLRPPAIRVINPLVTVRRSSRHRLSFPRILKHQKHPPEWKTSWGYKGTMYNVQRCFATDNSI